MRAPCMVEKSYQAASDDAVGHLAMKRPYFCLQDNRPESVAQLKRIKAGEHIGTNLRVAQMQSKEDNDRRAAQIMPGLVVQCVGGQKFGLKKVDVDEDHPENLTIIEGLEKLKRLRNGYKVEIKAAKDAAGAVFAEESSAIELL